MTNTPTKSSARSPAIDQFRGLAIVLMVLAHYTGGVACIPSWLTHAPDIGLTVTDLIAPLFIFTIGLTIGLSWRKCVQRDGAARAAGHFIVRYASLVGIGAILAAGEILLGENPSGVNWGVLQAIGTAGLLAIPVLSLPAPWRFGVGLALLAAYQLLLNRFWLPIVLGSPQGGLPGTLSWGAMLIMASSLADAWRAPHGRLRLSIFSLALLSAGIVSSLFIPLSEHRVSFSYVLVSLGASCLLFALCAWLVERWHCRWNWLGWWGRNPLLLYMVHLLLLGIMVLPGIPGWYALAPLWLAALQAAVLLGLLTALAWWLDRREVVVKI